MKKKLILLFSLLCAIYAKAYNVGDFYNKNGVKGVVVKVGDANDAGRIKNVTGTADYVKTVSSVPTTKDTSIIYNSGDGNFYVWRA